MRWLLAAALLMMASGSLWADDKPRLNVLFIVADDLNNNLGCYGHRLVQSPNIDRLATRGVRFDRAYCQYPVCNPSRTSFLSGRHPDTTGIVDNVTPTRTFLKDTVFLPQYFRQQGYLTLKVGKIFHTGDAFEDPRSWDEDLRETTHAKNPPASQIVRRQGQGGVVLKAADEDTWDGLVARQAVERMDKAVRQGKPFFLAVGFRRPHTPYIAPQKYFDMYPPQDILLPTEPPEHLQGIPPIALTYKSGGKPLTNQRRETMAAYYASISFMDAQVGVLLNALDRGRLWEKTVVVFMSDHGYHLGEHGGLWHKMSLFEESARVPLLVAVPGRKANTACQRLVELVDLFPSLTELCGLTTPAGLEGTSLVPLLDDPTRSWKKAAFSVVSRAIVNGTQRLDPTKMGRSLRTERYRYTEWFEGSAELYDHVKDPQEFQNLAKDPRHAKTVAELKQLLQKGWKAAQPGQP